MALVLEYPAGATPLDKNEIGGLKHKHITTQAELNELEQANIEQGLLWLSRQKANVLSDEFAVELHKRLFGDVWDWAGSFRTTAKNIAFVEPIQIPIELRMLMENTRYWVDHASYEPLEGAARFHHRLVQIHPFPNGNGRHSRIMADAVMTRVYDAKPIDWTAGEDLQKIGNRRSAYIAALRAADNGVFEPLLKFCQP